MEAVIVQSQAGVTLAGGGRFSATVAYFDDGRLAKLAEGTLDAARDSHRDKLERRSLEDLIEATVAADTASRKP